MRVDHAWFWVADMDRALRFYVDAVGLRLIHRHGDEWAELDAGRIRLALHGGGADARPLPEGGTVVFEVDDLDAARFALELREIAFEPGAGEVEGRGRFASFRDPDGNRLQLIEWYEEH